MSQDALSDFVSELNSDENLREAMKERFGDLSEGVPADDLISFAEEQGYSFTAEEASRELSEEELADVSGGTTLFDKASPMLSVSYDGTSNTFQFESGGGGLYN